MEFKVLYTHQKTKKAKTWHDGVLKVFQQKKKAALFDDKKNQIDSISVKSNQVIEVGCDLESGHYLIQVETLANQNCATATAAPEIAPACQSPMKCETFVQDVPVDAKKREAFVPPRQLIPQYDNDEVTIGNITTSKRPVLNSGDEGHSQVEESCTACSTIVASASERDRKRSAFEILSLINCKKPR